MFKKFGFFLFFLSLLFLALPVRAMELQVYPVRLYFFHSELCAHCKSELQFLETLKSKYPNLEVLAYEVSNDMKNQNLFSNVINHYQLKGYVPVNVIGDQTPIVGFDKPEGIGQELEERIAECSAKACPSWMDSIEGKSSLDKSTHNFSSEVAKNIENQIAGEGVAPSTKSQNLEVKIFGKKLSFSSETSVYFLGMILGLADGINPCMFSVLIFLLTYLLAIGSKKRAIKAGIAFAITTFVVYFLFMYGIIKVVDVLRLSQWMRWAVTIFALVAGSIMIKDFFFYGKGVSLEIPSRFKPKIEALVKKGTVLSAILLAVLSGIVELPCTSGLPLAYITVLTNQHLMPVGYLVWYNLFFVIPLIVIILLILFAFTKTERIEEWREKSKRYMRLVAGIILLLLAYALWRNWI